MLSSERTTRDELHPMIEVSNSERDRYGTQCGPTGIYPKKNGVVDILAPPCTRKANQHLKTLVASPFPTYIDLERSTRMYQYN